MQKQLPLCLLLQIQNFDATVTAIIIIIIIATPTTPDTDDVIIFHRGQLL